MQRATEFLSLTLYDNYLKGIQVTQIILHSRIVTTSKMISMLIKMNPYLALLVIMPPGGKTLNRQYKSMQL
jgi:hypothetical protein